MWAIEWGYRYFPDTITSDEERRQLGNNITQKTNDNRLWFGSEFATNDPRVQTEDIGNNAMRAGEYGIRNLQRIVPNLLEWTKTDGAGYAGLSEIYAAVKSQYSNYLRHVTRYVGGTYETIKVSNQPGPVYEAVPTERKQEAMRFLDKHLFQTPYWLLDTAVLSRLGSPPLQVVGRFQADVLSNLLDLNTLNELVFAESMYGDRTYTIMDFFKDIDQSIWKELANDEPVNQYRRLLQRYYVEKLILLQSSSTTGHGYNDVIPTVIAQLKSLRGRIRSSLKKVEDPMTVNHLQYIYDKINAALPPENKN
jgi:hypothetical protein